MQFECVNCRQPCCTCSNCQQVFTRMGKSCCTRCITGAQRVEDATQLQSVSVVLDNNIRRETKPNELLYINGR